MWRRVIGGGWMVGGELATAGGKVTVTTAGELTVGGDVCCGADDDGRTAER
jgi:hypothetical protein